MAQDEAVNVLDPSGKLGSLSKPEAEDAVKNYGFKLASDSDVTSYVDKQKYDNPLKAGALAAAGSATFGLARHALSKAGLVSQEEQAGLARYNPDATAIGDVAGVAGSLMVVPEVKGIEGLVGAFKAAKETGDAVKIAEAAKALSNAKNTFVLSDLLPVNAVAKIGGKAASTASPLIESATGLVLNPETSAIANKILNSTASHSIGSAVEGAAFGLGQSINESALGDPDVNAEQVLSNIGYGGLFGGALGAGMGAIGGAYSGIKGKAFASKLETQAARDTISENASQALGKPTSLDDISALAKQGQMMGMSSELPAKQLLNESIELAGPKQFPIHQMQIESLDSPHLRDVYGSIKKSGSDVGNDLNNLEAFQKQELIRDNNKLVDSISPKTLVSDPVEAGNKVIDSFVKADKTEREALTPYFKKFDSLSANSAINSDQILNKLEESLPGISKYISREADGFSLVPHDPTIGGVGEETHRELRKLVKALNKDDLTLGGIRNIRDDLGKKISFDTNPTIATEIGKLRKGLMDVYQDGIQAVNPELEVRDAFKRWAINEQEKTTIEKLLGGKLSDSADFGKQIKREDVLDKLFSNTNAVKSAKQLLGDDFNEALGNFLKTKIGRHTDLGKNGFSSNGFSTFLRNKNPELQEAFKDNIGTLQKIKAHTDIMRILPDAQSVNPSNTAKTASLLQRLGQVGSLLMHPSSIVGKGLHAISESLEQRKQLDIMNQVLSAQHLEKQANYSALANVERMAQKTTSQIQSKSKKIFSMSDETKDTLAGYAGSKLEKKEKYSNKEHEKFASQLNEYYSNPQKLMADLESNTKGVYLAAPNITASLHLAAARATSFLASKLPSDAPSRPLSAKPVLSQTEISKFQKYYDTVENPLSVLGHIKTGMLAPEHMEALISVYPKLYSQMQTSLISQMTNFLSKNETKDMPYHLKMTLSMFLGQDLDESLEQQSILANQVTLQGQGQEQAKNQVKQRVKTSQTGLSKLNLAESSMTEQQQASQREVEG